MAGLTRHLPIALTVMKSLTRHPLSNSRHGGLDPPSSNHINRHEKLDLPSSFRTRSYEKDFSTVNPN
jgi:hypothetical protein